MTMLEATVSPKTRKAVISLLVMTFPKRHGGRKHLLLLRSSTFRSAGQDQHRAAIRQQRNQRAQHHHQAAQPNPLHQRIQERMNHRGLRFRVLASVHDVQILAQCGVNRHHRSGLLVGLEEAPLRIQQHQRLVVAPYFDDHALGGVILLRLVVEALQQQLVTANLQCRARLHVFPRVAVERRARQPHENQHHAHVHDVAAIAPRIAHGQVHRGGEQRRAGARANHARAAEKLHADRGSHKNTKHQANQREELAHSEREYHDTSQQTSDQRPTEIALQAVRGSLAPGQQRPHAGEKQKQQPDRNIYFIEERRTHADARTRQPFRKYRKEGPRKDCDARHQQKQVVEQKARFTRNHRVQLVLALEIVAILDIGPKANREYQHQETHKIVSDARLRKSVNRANHAAARQQRPEDAEHERGENQPDVPNLHHPALFLHHHRMQESRARQPRQQRRVLDRIPAPVAAPTEHGVGPMRAQQNAHGLKAPRDHRPLASQVDPFFARIARQQRSQRKRKRNRKSRVTGIKIRRMNHHLRILQEWIQSVAVGASENLKRPIRSGGRQHLERAGHKIIQREEKNLHAGEHYADVRHQLPIFVAVNQQGGKNVNRQQKAPEKQRAFLP